MQKYYGGVARSTAYRVLKTFVHRGYMSKNEHGKYHFVTQPRKIRFGYASMCEKFPYSATVTESLEKAAKEAGVELLVLNNDLDEETAVANVEHFISTNVDLVIESHAHQSSAAHIAHRLAEASIPLITIDIPLPRSIFFGVDYYRSGHEAGKLLANHSLRHWQGGADIFLGLSRDLCGPSVDNRHSSALRTIRKELGHSVSTMKVIVRDTQGKPEHSEAITAEILKSGPRASRVLMIASSDSCMLGAVNAVRNLERQRDVAIVSHDCMSGSLTEMQKPDSSLIGSISHDAHTYGERLIEIGLRVLRNEPIDPYNFVEHFVLTREMAQEIHSQGDRNFTSHKQLEESSEAVEASHDH